MLNSSGTTDDELARHVETLSDRNATFKCRYRAAERLVYYTAPVVKSALEKVADDQSEDDELREICEETLVVVYSRQNG